MTHKHTWRKVKGSFLLECTYVNENRIQCGANKHEITKEVFE